MTVCGLVLMFTIRNGLPLSKSRSTAGRTTRSRSLRKVTSGPRLSTTTRQAGSPCGRRTSTVGGPRFCAPVCRLIGSDEAGAFKYVFLAAGSSLKGQSDLKKFEKARNLKEHIDRIRRDYNSELTDKTMATRQRATAMYLIDRLALRAGNEKGEDEADTVGCCSLRFEHVTLSPPNTVTFDFLGKDSIRFFQQVQVDEQVFKNLKIFKREPKDVGDLIFDRLTVCAPRPLCA